MKQFLSHFEWSADQYRRFSDPFVRWKQGRTVLKWGNLFCALIFYASYSLLLLGLFLRHDAFLWRAIVIPGAFFVLLSVFRRWLNRPRPYESLEIEPLLTKDSSGLSFPSRHIFSSFMIASTAAMITPWGFILYLPATLLALIRVIGGVHYPSDVIAGAGIALLASLLYLI